jgi:hypothetical protein
MAKKAKTPRGKRVKEKKTISLDKLQEETEKLLVLLKNREHGLFVWNDFLRVRLQNLHKLTSRALGK